MTIQEIIANRGIKAVKSDIEQINWHEKPYGLLCEDYREVIQALYLDGVVETFAGLSENGKPVWSKPTNSPMSRFTYRISPDYVLPEPEPEAFWGGVDVSGDDVFYLAPDGCIKPANTLVCWSKKSDWEFHGFWMVKDNARPSKYPFSPFMTLPSGKIWVKPFAKFVKKPAAD